MFHWFFAALHLLAESLRARRDARVRFLMAQVAILRRKLGASRVVPSPADRERLLALGRELDHDVAAVLSIVTPRTYSRWLHE